MTGYVVYCSVMFMPGGSVIVLWSRPKVSHEVLLGPDTIQDIQDAPEVSKLFGATGTTGCEWRMVVNCENASQIA